MDASSAVSAAVTVTPEAVNFSLLGLFLSADWIVKIVMLGLLGASVWCWAIIVDKSMLYGRAGREMNRFEKVFWSGQSLEELYQQMQERPPVGLGAIFIAAMKEWKRSHEQNAAAVGKREKSGPISVKIIWAVSVLIPGICVRSTPKVRERSSRSCGGSLRHGVLRGFLSFGGFSPSATLDGTVWIICFTLASTFWI